MLTVLLLLILAVLCLILGTLWLFTWAISKDLDEIKESIDEMKQ